MGNTAVAQIEEETPWLRHSALKSNKMRGERILPVTNKVSQRLENLTGNW